jgi:catechol 2,3-dioxygenase-like lactoylglutathione lyase family enzyme
VIHHLALAVKDFARAHEFYTDTMGFRLVKVVKEPPPDPKMAGWTRHVFYEVTDAESSLFALWDLEHLEGLPEWRPGISIGTGLPWWVNHVAFECADAESLEGHKKRWLDRGLTVIEVEHDFIRSIYVRDPEQNLVEWACRTRALGSEDVAEAERLLADDEPASANGYRTIIHRPEASRDTVGA